MTTPLSAFLSAITDADNALDEIKAHLNNHLGTNPDDLHWGNVGTAQEIAARLNEILEFIGE